MENIALTMTSASNVGVIVAIAPLFIALIAMFATREERVGVQFFAGFALAISGIALISFTGASAGEVGLAGCLLAVLAAFAWAVYSTIDKRIAKLGLSTVATTKRTFAWGLVFMLPFLPVMGFGQGAEGTGLVGLLDPIMLGNLLFLGLIASATCYVMWNKAASIVGVVNVSAYLYLTPVVTVVASVIVLAEPLTWQIVLGVALTALLAPSARFFGIVPGRIAVFLLACLPAHRGVVFGFSLLLAELFVCEQVVQSPKTAFELGFEVGHFACPRRSLLASHDYLRA